MKVFSWEHREVDTLMTPWDSIRYHNHFLRSGFMAMEPQTGHVKAYVGGPDFKYFKYDMVSTGKRQIGSTIKPYLYTLAMEGHNALRWHDTRTGDTVTETGEPGAEEYRKASGEFVTVKWDYKTPITGSRLT